MAVWKRFRTYKTNDKGLQTAMALLLLLFCGSSFLLWNQIPKEAAEDVVNEQVGSLQAAGEPQSLYTPHDAQEAENEEPVQENRNQEQSEVENAASVQGRDSGTGQTRAEEPARGRLHIVLDAGHGADDSGKLGINQALEKDVNLAIVAYLQELLQQHGITVTLTRSDDLPLYEEGVSNKKMSDMKKRIQIITDAQADAVVSIHQNSYTESAVCGPQVFYYKDSAEGERLATCIQSRFTDLLGEKNRRKVKANKDYYLLLHTPIPTVIVECGFLSNPAEAEDLVTESYQRQVAEVVCHGIMDYLGVE